MHSQDEKRTQLMLDLLKWFKIKSFIETGTYEGDTSRFFSPYVEKVYTCESYRSRFEKATELCKPFLNILVSNERSPDFLHTIQPEGPCFFYLDAHWEDTWPLGAEIDTIRHLYPESITLIDDCYVPGNPHFYGCFGGGGDRRPEWGGRTTSNYGPRLDASFVKSCLPKNHPFQILAPNYATSEKHEIGYLIMNGLEPWAHPLLERI